MSEEERAVTIEIVSNFLAAAEGTRFIDQKMISSRNALHAIVNNLYYEYNHEDPEGKSEYQMYPRMEKIKPHIDRDHWSGLWDINKLLYELPVLHPVRLGTFTPEEAQDLYQRVRDSTIDIFSKIYGYQLDPDKLDFSEATMWMIDREISEEGATDTHGYLRRGREKLHQGEFWLAIGLLKQALESPDSSTWEKRTKMRCNLDLANCYLKMDAPREGWKKEHRVEIRDHLSEAKKHSEPSSNRDDHLEILFLLAQSVQHPVSRLKHIERDLSYLTDYLEFSKAIQEKRNEQHAYLRLLEFYRYAAGLGWTEGFNDRCYVENRSNGALDKSQGYLESLWRVSYEIENEGGEHYFGKDYDKVCLELRGYEADPYVLWSENGKPEESLHHYQELLKDWQEYGERKQTDVYFEVSRISLDISKMLEDLDRFEDSFSILEKSLESHSPTVFLDPLKQINKLTDRMQTVSARLANPMPPGDITERLLRALEKGYVFSQSWPDESKSTPKWYSIDYSFKMAWYNEKWLEDVEAAVQLHHRCIELSRKGKLTEFHFQIGRSLFHLGEIERTRRNPKSAEKYYEDAIQSFALAGEGSNTIDHWLEQHSSGQEIYVKDAVHLLSSCYYGLGVVSMRENPGKSEEHLRNCLRLNKCIDQVTPHWMDKLGLSDPDEPWEFPPSEESMEKWGF